MMVFTKLFNVLFVSAVVYGSDLQCGFNKYASHRRHDSRHYRDEALRNEAPWLVRIIDKATRQWYCNGAIVDSRTIVTVASCFDILNFPISNHLQAVVGDHQLERSDSNERTLDINDLVVHPSYNALTREHDIALIFTNQSLTIDKRIGNSICLHNDSDGWNRFEIFGWGHSGSRILQKERNNRRINRLIVGNHYCRRQYRQIDGIIRKLHLDNENVICVASEHCDIDIGSPLISVQPNGQRFLEGIASTVPCGWPTSRRQVKFPTVFTRISSEINWINSILSNGLDYIDESGADDIEYSDTEIDINEENCGQTILTEQNLNVGFHSRIVGGSNAFVGQIPWQVQIENMGFICGGTIINRRMILTAAHCIEARSPSAYRVVAGLVSQTAIDSAPAITIGQIVKHPNYDANSNIFDFAVLITKFDIPFNSTSIRPVCLPNDGAKSYVSSAAHISGWGYVEDGRPVTPETLQAASVYVYSNVECQSKYSYNVDITDEMICAAAPGIDTCQGDSGGPMTVLEDGRYHLIGVTSFGISCARFDFINFNKTKSFQHFNFFQ